MYDAGTTTGSIDVRVGKYRFPVIRKYAAAKRFECKSSSAAIDLKSLRVPEAAALRESVW
jgi:hypothetical protein